MGKAWDIGVRTPEDLVRAVSLGKLKYDELSNEGKRVYGENKLKYAGPRAGKDFIAPKPTAASVQQAPQISKSTKNEGTISAYHKTPVDYLKKIPSAAKEGAEYLAQGMAKGLMIPQITSYIAKKSGMDISSSDLIKPANKTAYIPETAAEVLEFTGGLAPYVATGPLSGIGKSLAAKGISEAVPKLAGTTAAKIASGAAGGATHLGGTTLAQELIRAGFSPDEFTKAGPNGPELMNNKEIAQEIAKRVGESALTGTVFGVAGETVSPVARKAVAGKIGTDTALKRGASMGAGGAATGAMVGALDTAVQFLNNPQEFDKAIASKDFVKQTLFFAGLDALLGLLGAGKGKFEFNQAGQKEYIPNQYEFITGTRNPAKEGYREFKPGSGIWTKGKDNSRLIEIDHLDKNGNPVYKKDIWRQSVIKEQPEITRATKPVLTLPAGRQPNWFVDPYGNVQNVPGEVPALPLVGNKRKITTRFVRQDEGFVSRFDIGSSLKGLTKKQLNNIAKQYDVNVKSKDNKAKIIDKIVEATIKARAETKTDNNTYEKKTSQSKRKPQGEGIKPQEVVKPVEGKSEGLESKLEPELKKYADFEKLLEKKTKEYGDKNKYFASEEYKAIYPKVQELYKKEKHKHIIEGKKAMREAGVNFGDRVVYVIPDHSTATVDEHAGVVFSRAGIPYVRLDDKMPNGTKEIKWHKGMILEDELKKKRKETEEAKPKPFFLDNYSTREEAIKDTDLKGKETKEKEPWQMTEKEFSQNTPPGFVYDKHLPGEARTLPNGRIALGPKFFRLEPEARKSVLLHEHVHTTGIEEIAMKDNEFWRLVQKERMFGPIDKETGRMIQGINGQVTPLENLTEAYKLLFEEHAWLKEHYPKAYDYVAKLAITMGKPVPKEVLSDYPGLVKQSKQKVGEPNEKHSLYREANAYLDNVDRINKLEKKQKGAEHISDISWLGSTDRILRDAFKQEKQPGELFGDYLRRVSGRNDIKPKSIPFIEDYPELVEKYKKKEGADQKEPTEAKELKIEISDIKDIIKNSEFKEQWTFKGKTDKSGFSKYYQSIKDWEKNGKYRVYVPRNEYEQAGYITLDENDARGNNSGFYKGVWYKANRPGNINSLREFIDDLVTGLEKKYPEGRRTDAENKIKTNAATDAETENKVKDINKLLDSNKPNSLDSLNEKIDKEIREEVPRAVPKVGMQVQTVKKMSKQEEKSISFENPEIEERVEAARGIPPKTLKERLKEGLDTFKRNVSTEIKGLPRKLEFTEFRNIILQLRKASERNLEKTLNHLRWVTLKLNDYEYDLMRRKIILDDLAQDVEMYKDREMPFGFTPKELAKERTNIDKLIKSEPKVQEALEKRKELWDVIKNEYLDYMKSIGFDPSERLQRDDYYHHQVIEKLRADKMAQTGVGKRLRTPTGYGFLKRRGGSSLDYNTEYLEAEFEVLNQMMLSIDKAKAIKKIDKYYNITAKLKKDYKKELENILFDELGEEKEKLSITKMQERIEELSSGLLKKRNLESWEDLIPEGYEKWQPREGSVFYLASSIPEDLAEQLLKFGVEKIGVQAKDVKKILARGRQYREFVLPVEIVDVLNSQELISPIRANDFVEALKTSTKGWKVWQLLSPRRYTKYNLRNISGDAEAVFVGNPSAFSKVPRAMKELYQLYFGNRETSPELRKYVELGGLQTLLQSQENLKLDEVKMLKNVMRKQKDKKLSQYPAKWWHRYWTTARRTTDFREAILRYAAFLDYMEQIKKNNGKPDNFGASAPEEIMALHNWDDRAFWLANQLLGAYDQVSVVGQELRETISPFWSWQEVNFKRYVQLFKNAARDKKIASAVGKKLLIKSPVMAYKMGKFALKACGVWSILTAYNLLLFPDEEKELSEDVKRTLHIILGRNEDGTIRYFNRLGMLSDFLEWFGMDEAPYDVIDFLNGRRTLGEIIKDNAKKPVNKAVQTLTPFITAPLEAVAGIKFFPNAFSPGHIKDSMEYLAQEFGLTDEYRALKGRPQRPGGYMATLKKLAWYESTPEESAYWDIVDSKQRYLKRIGKSGGGYSYPNEKGLALYYFKQAIRLNDREAAERFLLEYFVKGGTPNGLKKSLRTLNPYYGLGDKKQEFIDSLTKEDREKLKVAVDFYNTMINTASEEITENEKDIIEAIKGRFSQMNSE